MLLLYILFGAIMLLLIAFRIGYINGAFVEKATKTECPKCAHRTNGLSKGRHVCESCSFEFDVDKKGYAIKYGITEIVTLIFFSTLSLVVAFYLTQESYNNFLAMGHFDFFGDLALPLVFCILTALGLHDVIQKVKGHKFYSKQN